MFSFSVKASLALVMVSFYLTRAAMTRASTSENVYQKIKEQANRCLADAQSLRCKLPGKFCDPKTPKLFCTTKGIPFATIKSDIDFITRSLEITIALHKEIGNLSRHVIITSSQDRATSMNELRKSLIEIQLTLLNGKRALNQKGMQSNNTSFDPNYYFYKFDSTLVNRPNCLSPHENTVQNQAYVVVNQLIWIYHQMKSKSNVFEQLSRKPSKTVVQPTKKKIIDMLHRLLANL